MIPSTVVMMMMVLILGPVMFYLYTKFRVVGKMGCFFLEKDKSITFKLYKVRGPHVEVDDEIYGVNPKNIRFIRFPFGWPPVLQQVVPCSLYQREDYQPLDINDPVSWAHLIPSKDNAIEISAVLEPRWLAAIVRGTKEGAPEPGKYQKLLPLMTLGVVVVTLVFLFYLLAQIGGLGGQMSDMQDQINLMK